ESQPTTSDETVVAGGTVVLKCQVEDPDDSSLQWSNPAQQTLYFGEKRALRDNRIQLQRSTPNELTISITDVVLADEGEYTCSIFTMPVRTAKALVTVLGTCWCPPASAPCLGPQTGGRKPAAQLRWKKGNKELKAEGTEVVEDPNGKTFTVSSRVEFRVTKEDNDAEVTCTVDHESLQNSERSTTQKLQVHCTWHVGDRDTEGPQEFLWEKEGSDAPLQLSSDSILIFPFLNKSDSGTYVCKCPTRLQSHRSISSHPVPAGRSTPEHPSDIPPRAASPCPFVCLALLIVLGHYLIRHKGTYLTHEAKGSDDAPDADTAIINAEGGQAGGDDKKEYFI
ncbi:Cell adhesion molecule 3, partial [Anas platyrhynchos]